MAPPFEGELSSEARLRGCTLFRRTFATHPFWRANAGAPLSHTGRAPCSVTVRASDALTPVAHRQWLSTIGDVQCSTLQRKQREEDCAKPALFFQRRKQGKPRKCPTFPYKEKTPPTEHSAPSAAVAPLSVSNNIIRTCLCPFLGQSDLLAKSPAFVVYCIYMQRTADTNAKNIGARLIAKEKFPWAS